MEDKKKITVRDINFVIDLKSIPPERRKEFERINEKEKKPVNRLEATSQE